MESASDAYASFEQVTLQVRHRVLGVVENGRSKRRVGAPFLEDLGEVIERAGAARGDDRDGYGSRNGCRQLAIESRSRAVTIDGGQQDFTRAARFGFDCPLHSVTFGGCATAPREDLETA